MSLEVSLEALSLHAELRLDPSSLPPDLFLRILALLPVDALLRCSAVSAAWRAALAEHTLWTSLDLSASSGLRPPPRGPQQPGRLDSLLAAALPRSRGRLRHLDVSGRGAELSLEAVLSACSPSLRSLRLSATLAPLSPPALARLLSAAPSLAELRCDLLCSPGDALEPLRRQPPFAALCLAAVHVRRDDAAPPDVASLACAVAAHRGLRSLTLQYLPLDVVQLEALADSAHAAQLQRLSLLSCSLQPAHLRPLTCLLHSACLTELEVADNYQPLFAGSLVPAFCAALRRCALRRLALHGVCLWHSLADGLEVVAAVGDASRSGVLSEASFFFNGASARPAQLAAGAALGGLVSGEGGVDIEHGARGLRSLGVSFNSFGEGEENAGISLLFAALARGGKLQRLVCWGNGVDAQAARRHVLPAVRANASLRELRFVGGSEEVEELREAEAIVAARAGADAVADG